MLSTLGLVIIMLYCGIRTLMTLSAGRMQITQINSGNSGISLESVLRELEQSFFAEADTINLYDVTRNPLSVSKPVKSPVRPSWRPKRRGIPRLTGLVLDENPVAIMEIKGVSVKVEIGDLLDGNKVIQIDEQGVHVLIDGKLETIR